MIKMNSLPYDKKALEPVISSKTIDYHYGKHHTNYYNQVMAMIDNTELKQYSLEKIVTLSWRDHEKKPLFNSAAQLWNHNFFWSSLKPYTYKSQPNKHVLQLIESEFSSYQRFIEVLEKACITLFGSGWVWIILDKGSLSIEQTENALTPLVYDNKKPLAVIDVWEHAYYIDYFSNRKEYILQLINHLLNWDFVNENLYKYTSK